MVVELVGAFNELTERMGEISTTSSSQLLFKCLKLSFPLLQSLPFTVDGRPWLSQALSVAFLLAGLQANIKHIRPRVLARRLLKEPLLAGAITIHEVKSRIGTSTAHPSHESLRIKSVPSKVDSLDDESASALRKYCLTYYDIKGEILDGHYFLPNEPT